MTRSTNDVRQIQYLVQITGTVLITAPIMCVGGIVMAIHQEAALTWLLLVSVPVLAVANYWIMSHMLPLFRGMQGLIDGINRVMRDQLSGVRVVRAFTREGFERDRFARANAALSNTALARGQLAGADAAGDHADHQRVQRRADLVRRAAHRSAAKCRSVR